MESLKKEGFIFKTSILGSEIISIRFPWNGKLDFFAEKLNRSSSQAHPFPCDGEVIGLGIKKSESFCFAKKLSTVSDLYFGCPINGCPLDQK